MLLAGDADAKTITQNFGPQAIEAAGAAVSGGTYNIRNAAELPPDKRDDFITKLFEIEWQKAEFKPVRMHLTQGAVEPRARAARPPKLPPPPTWPAMDAAQIFFMQEEVPRSYCLLAKRKIVFGRMTREVDVKLLEVEECKRRLQLQYEQGEKPRTESAVSRRQWLLEAAPDGVRVHHVASRKSFVTGGKALGQGDPPHLMQRNGHVEIGVPDVIGLKMAASAVGFAKLAEVREKARKILGQMKSPPRPMPDWEGPNGGYTLTRLHSLTGAVSEKSGDYPGFEAYVLVPGWVTVGSVREACVVIPNKDVAPLHAYLLHVDGYFFVYAPEKEHTVLVNKKEVGPEWPLPLKPESDLQFGDSVCHFGQFKQLYV